MKRPISFVLLSFFMGLFFVAAQARPRETNKRNGRVSGMVLDTNDARVAGARVTIEARDFKRKLSTSPEGKFRLELPAGDYDLTVDANGFCLFQGPLTVTSGVTEMLNIHLEVAVMDSPNACKCTLRSRRNVRRPLTYNKSLDASGGSKELRIADCGFRIAN